jgi:hypothetical protein
MPRGNYKKQKPTSTSLWTEFEKVYPMQQDGTPVELEEGEQYWRNSFYLVLVKQLDPSEGETGPIRLDIRHNQDKAIREWKHLQRIKNELVGEEREAMEIFPPQSMIADMSNTHHLFVPPVGVSSVFVYEEKIKQESVNPYSVILASRGMEDQATTEEEVSEGQ